MLTINREVTNLRAPASKQECQKNLFFRIRELIAEGRHLNRTLWFSNLSSHLPQQKTTATNHCTKMTPPVCFLNNTLTSDMWQYICNLKKIKAYVRMTDTSKRMGSAQKIDKLKDSSRSISQWKDTKQRRAVENHATDACGTATHAVFLYKKNKV